MSNVPRRSSRRAASGGQRSISPRIPIWSSSTSACGCARHEGSARSARSGSRSSVQQRPGPTGSSGTRCSGTPCFLPTQACASTGATSTHSSTGPVRSRTSNGGAGSCATPAAQVSGTRPTSDAAASRRSTTECPSRSGCSRSRRRCRPAARSSQPGDERISKVRKNSRRWLSPTATRGEHFRLTLRGACRIRG